MANSDIMVRAQARKLFQSTGDERLSEYKKMPIAEIEKVIKAIDSGAKGTAKGPAAKGAKGASATKGAATPAKPEPAKVSQKGAKAKNAKKGTASSVKSAPAEKSAKSSTKGATGKAKRPATTVKAKAKSNGKVAKGVATKLRKVKGKFHIPKTYEGETLAASNGTGRVTKNPKRGEAGFRAPLDREAIDWTAPWNGGQRGSRGIVLESLRENKGDYEAVFKQLRRRAERMYENVGNPIGGTVLTHLKWHIARTAFDFALGTGQHAPGTRVPNGESTRRQDVKKRQARKPTSPRKRATAAKGKKTQAKARKATAGRTTRKKGTSKKGR